MTLAPAEDAIAAYWAVMRSEERVEKARIELNHKVAALSHVDYAEYLSKTSGGPVRLIVREVE